jgi:4-amino-4-deoxy-L-arabinose transferase-like glycosyltransferase
MMPIMARWICDGGLDALERELQRRPATWLWAILAVAFVARIVVAAVFTDFDPTTANIWEYGEIARATLAHGHGQMVSPMGILYSGPPSFVYPTALMPPFVIWVWIGLFALFGVTKLALSMMTVLNVLTSVGIVYYSIRIARALFGSEVIALLAGIVMALHPVFVYSVATYHALNI